MKTSNKMIMQATLYTNITPKFKFQTTPKQRYNKNHKTANKTRDTKKAVKKHTEQQNEGKKRKD